MSLCNSPVVYGSPKLSSTKTNEDRISNLPNDITGHILSRLPTKNALKTCVLSRDWKYKWTTMYNVVIDKDPRFISFVNRELDLTHNSRVRSFRMFCGNKSDPQQISTWLSTVLNREVQNFVVEGFKAVLGRCLADCTSLTSLILSLSFCTLEVPVKNCFSNLKSLYLNGTLEVTQISKHQSLSARHILLNFPVLEFLELKYCNFSNVKTVEIQAPELLTFKAHTSFNYNLNDYVIKIRGSKLAKFYTFGFELNIFDLCAPSLYYVDIQNVTSRLDLLVYRAEAILKGVTGLTCLRLEGGVVQALMNLGRGRGSDLPILDRLKRLEVECYSDNKMFLALLKMMPNLEYLNIVFRSSTWGRYYYEQNPPLEPCTVSHLKEVKCINFHGKSDEIDLINLLLENATKLERVFVYPAPNSYSKISVHLSTLASTRSASVTISERPRATSFEQEASLEAKTRSSNNI